MLELQPHLHILPEAQRDLWPLLAPISKTGFVLYGGTALALQIGHRNSIDFDFFTEHTFENNKLIKSLSFLGDLEVEQSSKNTLTVRTNKFVKFSFFGEINFGRVGEPLLALDTGILVASLDDLMATKLKVIFDRIECKDYIDIAAMIRHGVDLPKGLASSRAMFGGNFQPAEALKALTYFEGGDLSELSACDKQLLLDAARQVKDLPNVQVASHTLSCSEDASPKKKNRMR